MTHFTIYQMIFLFHYINLNGYYFNQTALVADIFGTFICMFTDKSLILNSNGNFKNKTVKQLYFPNYKKTEASILKRKL